MKGLCAIISGGEYSPMDDIKAAEYIMENDLCFEEFLNLYPEKKLHVTFGPEA